jgi:hypothetical protein
MKCCERGQWLEVLNKTLDLLYIRKFTNLLIQFWEIGGYADNTFPLFQVKLVDFRNIVSEIVPASA